MIRVNFKKFLTVSSAMLLSLFGFQAPLSAVWEPPVVISNPAIPLEEDSAPVLKVNPQGNAIAIWTDAFSSVFPSEPAIATAFFVQGFGWQPPQVISSLAANCRNNPLFIGQGNPDVALNNSNFALAVWQGETNECYGNELTAADDGVIFASARNLQGIWSPPQIISNDAFLADNANVSLNQSGQGLAAWRNFTNGQHFISASFFTGGSWQSQTNFPPFPALDGEGKPYPFINNLGNAVITYQARTDATTFTIEVVNFIGAWSSPHTLDTGTFNISQDPRCALADNGNAVAIWQNGGLIRASFFNGASWGAAVTLGDAAALEDHDGPEVVVDPDGNFTATWTAANNSIKSSSTSNGVWSAAITISTPGTPYSFDPFRSQETLAVNTRGDVIAIWHAISVSLAQGVQSAQQPLQIAEPPFTPIFSAFKPFSFPWRPQEIVATPFDGFIDNTLNIGLADCGFAVAIWQNAPNTFVYATENGGLITPVNPMEFQCCEKGRTRCINILTWAPDDCVLFFNIFCNGDLIATVVNNGDPLRFVDTSCRNCVYTISAVSILGFEGPQVPFVVN